MSDQLNALTQINLDDLVSSFGWENLPLLAALVRHVFVSPARRFASQMVEFDNEVGQTNLAEASRKIMRRLYVRDVRVHGREHIPTTGPVFYLSNHPGLTDTISLFAAINRADLKIIALQRPFLVSLTNTTRQLFFIDDDPAKRMNAVRQVSNHLRNGGAALTFPAGKIEPDPEVYPGALDSFNHWTDSAGVFIRFAPQTKIVPVLVSGVIWEKAAQHWITRLKRTRFEREKLAAAFQLLAMIMQGARPTTIHVHFARPITLEEVGSTDAQGIHQVVIKRMQDLLQHQTNDEGVAIIQTREAIPNNLGKNPSIKSVY